MAKKNSFDSAYAELEKILDNIQSEETGIDTLSVQLKDASKLVNFCKSKLREISDEISSLSDEQE